MLSPSRVSLKKYASQDQSRLVKGHLGLEPKLVIQN